MRTEGVILGMACALIGAAWAQGQQPAAIGRAGHVSPGRIHGFAEKPWKALGKRMQEPGLERSTTLGTVTDSSGSFGLRVIREQPGKVRLERSGPGAAILLVDDAGRSASNKGGVQEAELDMLESLSADSPETMLNDLAEGAGGRFLGSGFRATDDRTRTYQGPLHDVFDVFTGAGFRPGQPRRHKRYYFDGSTGLLASVRYLQGPIAVETRYGGWEDRSGEKVAAVVQRFENGSQIFTFRSTATVFESKKADGAFARP